MDSGRRLSILDFSMAQWPPTKEELSRLDWNPMNKLEVLKLNVPLKSEKRGRNCLHRKRKLNWRKLRKMKAKL